MADPAVNTAQPTVPGEGPPPGAPPPVGAAPTPGQPADQQRFIRIPQGAFKDRVNRAAAQEVQRRLGVSIEEAEALVKRAGTQASTPGATAAAATTTTVDAAVALQQQLEEANNQLAETQRTAKDAQREIQRLKDKQIETELKFLASKAGIVDPDYGIHLFAKAAAEGRAEDPEKFFSGLRESHKHLYSDAPGSSTAAPTIRPTTAPPESPAIGGETPKPSPAGGTQQGPDVDKMTPQQFADYRRRVYQFNG